MFSNSPDKEQHISFSPSSKLIQSQGDPFRGAFCRKGYFCKKKTHPLPRIPFTFEYCKSGNVRATFMFALFALQPGCAKIKAHEYVHFVLRSTVYGRKFKIANLKTSETIQNRQIAKKNCARKLPLLQYVVPKIFFGCTPMGAQVMYYI